MTWMRGEPTRIKKKFVCILHGTLSITDCVKLVLKHYKNFVNLNLHLLNLRVSWDKMAIQSSHVLTDKMAVEWRWHKLQTIAIGAITGAAWTSVDKPDNNDSHQKWRRRRLSVLEVWLCHDDWFSGHKIFSPQYFFSFAVCHLDDNDMNLFKSLLSTT